MNLMRLFLVLIALAAANSFGASDQTARTQATLLDHNAFLCDNCLFGMNDYYFCFQAGDKILIGHDKVRTQMKHKNPSELIGTGKSLPIRYDDRFIWVAPEGSKEIKLKQDYATQIFLNDKKCQAATHAEVKAAAK